MIHRRILDVAASDPDASLAAIADEVSGASADLVERVLDEYGDPGREANPDGQDTEPADGHADGDGPTAENTESAADDTEPVADDAESTANDTEPAADDSDVTPGDPDPTPDHGTPTASSLPEKQRRTLRALYERPDASQGDLAEELDVTRATVCRRLNAIPGFEWTERNEFTESVFGDDAPADPEPSADPNDDTETDGPSPAAETASNGQADDVAAAAHGRAVEGDGGRPGSGLGPPEDAAGAPETDRESASDDGEDPTEAGVDRDGTRAEPERADEDGRRSGSDGRPLADVRSTVAALDERIEELETRVDRGSAETAGEGREADGTETGAGESVGSLRPELAHKVVHACMESDRVTEDEELDVLRTFMQG
ncbi:winged helix-turn-helix transcriptional regulator [Halosimplex amylolyticum]|uniref:winged helix-turn-helix transcriptional regulator n=1 Tax=Halosimplex amylolyticum TaxID=3396616 RepID=UPI003F55F9AD